MKFPNDMTAYFRYTIMAFLAVSVFTAKAGNPQRAGSAGAAELLINPWAKTAGWSSVNVAGVSGIEATFLNIAGAANTKKTDIGFTNTQWLIGAGISINSFALNQKVGQNGVMAIGLNAYSYGDWEITTINNPDGGVGSISPTAAVISVGYSQRFLDNMYGGINLKLYNSSMVDMRASAICIDAGIQYVTGDRDQIKFGITLSNVGPAATYRGDGQSLTLTVPEGGYAQAYEERAASFELPATLAMGGSYDWEFAKQRFTLAGSFRSNSFEKDQFTIGGEYAIKEMVMVRSGYTFFDNSEYETTTTVFTGFSAGISLSAPLGENGRNRIGIDYSYRATSSFDGVQSIGVTLSL